MSCNLCLQRLRALQRSASRIELPDTSGVDLEIELASTLLPRHGPVVMYIYKTMDTGLPDDDQDRFDENMRIIEVEGHPTSVVGIRYKTADTAPPPAGIARTVDGKLVDTSPQSEDVAHEEYWADRPSGFCGGKRLTSTLQEDVAVIRRVVFPYRCFNLVAILRLAPCAPSETAAGGSWPVLGYRSMYRKVRPYGTCLREIPLVQLEHTGEHMACQALACF